MKGERLNNIMNADPTKWREYFYKPIKEGYLDLSVYEPK